MPVVGSGLAALEENRQDLKVPLTFSVLPRTERLIDWLVSSANYKDRGNVIASCEAVLSDLYTEYYVRRMTKAERQIETQRARKQQLDAYGLDTATSAVLAGSQHPPNTLRL